MIKADRSDRAHNCLGENVSAGKQSAITVNLLCFQELESYSLNTINTIPSFIIFLAIPFARIFLMIKALEDGFKQANLNPSHQSTGKALEQRAFQTRAGSRRF